tara:strand:+ start:197201 stop:198316 length:1116 start_codon:yes stop_codon:yes gene_type:complete
MKLVVSLILVMVFVSCQKEKNNTASTDGSTAFYVGTYTDGESEGIYKYKLLKDGQLERVGLVAKTVNPSYLTKSDDGKYLLAVNEVNNNDGSGFIESFKITKDSLILIDKASSGGAYPCYLTTNSNNYILAANYTGGNLGLLQLNSKGELSDLLDVEQHEGNGATERQKGPHVHAAKLGSDNTIISADLGTNELWFSKIDTLTNQFQPLSQDRLEMEIGAGPRHFVIHPNGMWVYVINELNSTITLVNKTTSGTYQVEASISTLPTDFEGANSCADIHISWGGKFVYASNRGHDSIAIFKVNQQDGTLSFMGTEPTRGKSPRNFSLSPDENFVIVANQNTDNIISFKRDQGTGMLSFVDEIKAPKPVCILF